MVHQSVSFEHGQPKNENRTQNSSVRKGIREKLEGWFTKLSDQFLHGNSKCKFERSYKFALRELKFVLEEPANLWFKTLKISSKKITSETLFILPCEIDELGKLEE